MSYHNRLYLIETSADNFANSLDPDQTRQNVWPDLDLKLFDTLIVSLTAFFEKFDFEKISRRLKSGNNFQGGGWAKR